MAETLEIYLSDLNSEAQQKVFEFLGIKSAAEANLDVFSLFALSRPEWKSFYVNRINKA